MEDRSVTEVLMIDPEETRVTREEYTYLLGHAISGVAAAIGHAAPADTIAEHAIAIVDAAVLRILREQPIAEESETPSA